MSQPHCYAIRLVNPYTGVLQVLNHGIARSLSRNGFNWEIQIQVERKISAWGSRSQVELKYFRYGFWNPTDGLLRVPTDPSVDIGILKQGYKIMLQQLRSGLLEQMPFPLEDRFELWWLDKKQKPLALLGTTCDKNMIPRIRVQRWHAVSASLNSESYSQRKAEQLENHIRLHSGKRQWFHRGSNGEAIGLQHHTSADLVGRVLPSDSFPELLVREDWDDTPMKQLVGEWAGYMAPWLLQLQGINEQRRGRLEQQACRNPEMLDILHCLYPSIIDERLINTSRLAVKQKSASK